MSRLELTIQAASIDTRKHRNLAQVAPLEADHRAAETGRAARAREDQLAAEQQARDAERAREEAANLHDKADRLDPDKVEALNCWPPLGPCAPGRAGTGWGRVKTDRSRRLADWACPSVGVQVEEADVPLPATIRPGEGPRFPRRP